MQIISQHQKHANEAIEKRRQHMIVRADHMKQFRSSALFNLADHRL